MIEELNNVHLTSALEHVLIEHDSSSPIHWCRMYFSTPEDADTAATELNVPFRPSRYRNTVTQRMPLRGAHSGEIGTITVFEALEVNPPDTIVVDTQEGYVFFGTDELYKTKGALDFLEAKRNRQGRIIRRLICKHFDPQRRIPCRYGVQCAFIHIKAYAMTRVLRTTPHTAPLRFAKNEQDVHVSSWDFERRLDTLVVRQLDATLNVDGLRYMFEACPGFVDCTILRAKIDQRYGVVRFDSKDSAMMALTQTFDSDLNVGMYGVMEDLRRSQMQQAKDNGTQPPQGDSRHPEGARKTEGRALPFPALPEGWAHGVSQQGKYYFFQLNSKNSTRWAHPVTNETYGD